MAGRAAEFVNYIGRNVVVASRSGPVETVPTVPVATALSVCVCVCMWALCVHVSVCMCESTCEHAGMYACASVC